MFTSYIRVMSFIKRCSRIFASKLLCKMGRPPLCILSDSSFYTFHRNSKGVNLWHFLHQRFPNQFPSPKFVFPFSFILAALDCLIKNEKLFDETNWEVICLPECSELFFRSRFLHISELEYEIRQCLFLHKLAPSKDPQRIEASWTIETKPLPFLQRLLASNFILATDDQYYLSHELTRFFHGKHFSRYYLNRKLLPGYRVAELFQRHLDYEELTTYPKNNSIIFCEGNALLLLCRSKTLHVSQLDGLLASHCNIEQTFPSDYCEHCRRIV